MNLPLTGFEGEGEVAAADNDSAWTGSRFLFLDVDAGREDLSLSQFAEATWAIPARRWLSLARFDLQIMPQRIRVVHEASNARIWTVFTPSQSIAALKSTLLATFNLTGTAADYDLELQGSPLSCLLVTK